MHSIESVPHKGLVEEPLCRAMDDVGFVLLAESISALHSVQLGFTGDRRDPDVRGDLPKAPHGTAALEPPQQLRHHDVLLLSCV
jgi:hypothetical protein